MVSLYFQIFYRYCFSSRAGAIVRSMARISWVGTLIGVAALILISSVMNGFNRSIRTKLLAVEPHIVVTHVDPVLARAELSRIKGAHIAEFVSQDVILRSLDGHFSGAVAKALPENEIYEFLNRAVHLKYKNGVGPDLPRDVMSLAANEAIVGNDLARDLNVFEGDELMVIPPETLLLPPGETPKYERMRVKTIVSTELPEVDNKLLLYRLGSGAALRFQSSSQEERGFEVRLSSPSRADDEKEFLAKYLGAKVTIETWGDRNRALFFALKLEKIAMLSFLSLGVLIASFSLITVLTLLLSQKRKEIGLLMALGLSGEMTKRLFLAVGVVLSGFGLFAGAALGVVVSLLLEKYPLEILPDIYYDSALPSEINWIFVISVALGCLVVAALSAYGPVRRYLRFSPSENLRPYGGQF
jgi:lipoprotein-releasing system permease protein